MEVYWQPTPQLATRLALDYSIVKNSTTEVGEFSKGPGMFSTLMIIETAIEALTFSTVSWALAPNYELKYQSYYLERRYSSKKAFNL